MPTNVKRLSATGIEMEFLGEPPYESCCFCRSGTGFWAVKADVACCMECADKHEEKDLPTKEEWFEKERQLMMLERQDRYGKFAH